MPVTTLAVVGDTHIPDRRRQLHPELLPALRSARPTAILHTGDVSVQSVLDILGEIAPVYAVMGNRDIFKLSHLPMSLHLEFGGVKIGLVHGHGGLGLYVKEKIWVRLRGYHLSLFQPYLFATCPEDDVIVFGHSHAVENRVVNGKLLFNPASASMPYLGVPPSFGLLTIENGAASGQVRYLTDDWKI